MSATGSKLSHAILSSSPLAPNDAADPKKRLWKERYKSQQLRKMSRARDIDSARMSSKQLFNLDEVDDEDDDFLQQKVGDLSNQSFYVDSPNHTQIDNKVDERDYKSDIRRKESRYDLHVGSDYDPLAFWSEAEEDIPDDLDDLGDFDDVMDTGSASNPYAHNTHNNADTDDLFDDDELDALYEEYLANQNQQDTQHNADASMDMS